MKLYIQTEYYCHKDETKRYASEDDCCRECIAEFKARCARDDADRASPGLGTSTVRPRICCGPKTRQYIEWPEPTDRKEVHCMRCGLVALLTEPESEAHMKWHIEKDYQEVVEEEKRATDTLRSTGCYCHMKPSEACPVHAPTFIGGDPLHWKEGGESKG